MLGQLLHALRAWASGAGHAHPLSPPPLAALVGGAFRGGVARAERWRRGVRPSPRARFLRTRAAQRPALCGRGGARGSVHGPVGRGAGGRRSERQRVRPGGGGGAGSVHIHLEEENGAEDQDHRDGECGDSAPARAGPRGGPASLAFPCWRCRNAAGAQGTCGPRVGRPRRPGELVGTLDGGTRVPVAFVLSLVETEAADRRRKQATSGYKKKPVFHKLN